MKFVTTLLCVVCLLLVDCSNSKTDLDPVVVGPIDQPYPGSFEVDLTIAVRTPFERPNVVTVHDINGKVRGRVTDVIVDQSGEIDLMNVRYIDEVIVGQLDTLGFSFAFLEDGVYFARVKSPGNTTTVKLFLVRPT